ncbi:MAG: hypothetical protein KGL39_14290 [Patescibacteria group bacterium]|nr:hypothetical protein [Patescibacteria group bacterium]
MAKDPNEIGALWQAQGDKKYVFSGVINGERVVVFENTRKTNGKAPDYRVVRSTYKSDSLTTAVAPVADAITDDDIPF